MDTSSTINLTPRVNLVVGEPNELQIIDNNEFIIEMDEAESSLPENTSCFHSDKTKKAIKDIAIGIGISAVGTTFMVLSPSGSLLQLTGSDIIVSATKTNIIKKVPHVNAVLFSFPAFAALTGISYFIDPTKISTAIFGGLLAKEISKVFKNLMKGQPVQEACTEGLPENIRKKLTCCSSSGSDEVPEVEDDDDDDDDREWEPPSWKMQTVLIGGISILALGSYAIPQLAGASTTIATVYLMNTLAKVATVGLRQLPIIPGAVTGALAAGGGAVVDFAFPGALPIKVFPPLALFGWQVASDSIQMYLKGKLDKRNWVIMPCCEKSLQETDDFEEPDQIDKKVDKALKGEKGDKKIEKEDKKPSGKARATTIFLSGVATIGANVLQPDGGLLPQAMNGSFSQIFTKGAIGKPDKDTSPEATVNRLKLVGARGLFYGGLLGAAYGADAVVHVVSSAFSLKFSSVATSFILKMGTSKEIKEVTNLSYTREMWNCMTEEISTIGERALSGVQGMWERMRCNQEPLDSDSDSDAGVVLLY